MGEMLETEGAVELLMVWDDTSGNHVSSVEDLMEFEGELLTSQPHGLELGASK